MRAAIRSVLSQYATFSGRARRPEYWWWVLFLFLLVSVTRLIDYTVIMPLLGATGEARQDGQPLSAIVSLALLLPTLAVGVRRLHDIGRSGWWMLMSLVPIVGTLVLLYFFVQPSRDRAA